MNESITPKGYVPRVKFQVTAQNIKHATGEDSRHCMIADAIKAQLPNIRNISVDMMHIRWSDPSTGWRYIYQMPKAAQYALIDFDMGLPLEPFSFEVRSGLATPMQRGAEKKRAHKVRENKILKVTDKTMVHSVTRDSVPRCVKGMHTDPVTGFPIARIGEDHRTPLGTKGRPKEWHPSHNSLRRFGMRGFTEGYIKVKSSEQREGNHA